MKFESPFTGVEVPDYAKKYKEMLETPRFHNPHQQIQEDGPEVDEYNTRRLEHVSEQLNRSGGKRMGGRGRRAGMTYASGPNRGLTTQQAMQKASDDFDSRHQKFQAPYGDHTTTKQSWNDSGSHRPDSTADWQAVADMKNGVVERGPNHTRFDNGAYLQKNADGSKQMVTPYGTISSGPTTKPTKKPASEVTTPSGAADDYGATGPDNTIPKVQPKPKLEAPKPAFQHTEKTPHPLAAAVQDEMEKRGVSIQRKPVNSPDTSVANKPQSNGPTTGPIERIYGLDREGLDRDEKALNERQGQVEGISSNLDRIAVESGLDHLTQANFNKSATLPSQEKFEAPKQTSTATQTLQTAQGNISQVGNNVNQGLSQAAQHPAVQKTKGALKGIATAVSGVVESAKEKDLSNPTMKGIADNIQGTGTMRFEAPKTRPIIQGKNKSGSDYVAEGAQKLIKKWNANPTVQGIRNTWNGTGPMRFEAPKTLRPPFTDVRK